MANSAERQIGRAKNAVLSFLEQRLSIPKIYIDAYWSGQRIDVLAINRDGAGDVHAVMLFANSAPSEPEEALANYLTSVITPLVKRFETIPAQYKYIAAVDVIGNGDRMLPGIPHPVVEASFSPDGVGRIGFMSVNFPALEEPRATLLFKPERFRASVAKLADEYVLQHEADWEIRA